MERALKGCMLVKRGVGFFSLVVALMRGPSLERQAIRICRNKQPCVHLDYKEVLSVQRVVEWWQCPFALLRLEFLHRFVCYSR